MLQPAQNGIYLQKRVRIDLDIIGSATGYTKYTKKRHIKFRRHLEFKVHFMLQYL
jgi:hypothetical protein